MWDTSSYLPKVAARWMFVRVASSGRAPARVRARGRNLKGGGSGPKAVLCSYLFGGKVSRSRVKFLVCGGVTAVVLAVGPASAAAFTGGGGQSGSAPGQAHAIENCSKNIPKQNANGQIGSLTGSPNDEKLLPTAVTNCDHFWEDFGANP